MLFTDKKLDVIDKVMLVNDLAQLGQKNNQADFIQNTRTKIIERLKKAMNEGRAKSQKDLKLNSNGLLCARRLSHLNDIIIQQLYHFTLKYVLPQPDLQSSDHIALIAVGGYGRGTMAPSSDIDLQFLLSHEQTTWSKDVIKYILYMLWDLGLKIGHSTCNVDSAICLAKENMTVRTALLETRFLVGGYTLYNEFLDRFECEVIPNSAPKFIRTKLNERDERHYKTGKTRYLVEPNIKQGKGGQRDLQTLLWVTKYYYRIKSIDELVAYGVLSKAELRIFKKADNFLWAVRCHMHFLANKPVEWLSFNVQRDIAHCLGYTAHQGLEDVERFMKNYFLMTKNVGDLTRVICAHLEEKHAKPAPGFKGVFSNKIQHQECIDGTNDFFIDNMRINIKHNAVFKNDPINLIRLFYFADKHDIEYHPRAMQEASRALKFITKDICQNVAANTYFLSILTSKKDPAKNLTRMNESGVLGKFIPEFGRVVAMMQFNMYHHYTVDEHLIRCIAYLRDLEHDAPSNNHPLAASFLPLSQRERMILYVAVFLHDIAKGREEDHSIAGERIARKLAPRFGLSSIETETVTWLIREHLTMSRVAQSRDLSDPKTINDFAKIVHTSNRLKLLLLLTICDINGVGPDVWNGWKGQLLRTLYFETKNILSNSSSKLSHAERIDQTKNAFSMALTNWDQDKTTAYLELHYPSYWPTTSLDDQVRHANFIKTTDEQGKKFAVEYQLHSFKSITEITVLAPDHPRLLSIIAGACAAANSNIVDAHIFTTTDGRALDTIFINHKFECDEDEIRRATRIIKMIENALSGNIELPEVIMQQVKPKQLAKAFTVLQRIEINNLLSQEFSVIEIKCMDRTGLLYELTRAISNLSLNISSAHISTFGEKAIDTFYVTDLKGDKILNPQQQDDIKNKILILLDHKDGR